MRCLVCGLEARFGYRTSDGGMRAAGLIDFF